MVFRIDDNILKCFHNFLFHLVYGLVSFKMARVSVGIPLQIVLMICLSVVEFIFQGDGRNYFILEATDLIDLLNHVFDNRFLGIVTIERSRAIRRSNIIPLAILRSWIMDLEKVM